MHRSGVKILAGVDEPNQFCFPGFSLHDELGLLVQAGLTPFEALQTATVNPGGAYLIWLWLKNGSSFLFGLAGSAVLVLYGLMNTTQASKLRSNSSGIQRIPLRSRPSLGLAGE